MNESRIESKKYWLRPISILLPYLIVTGISQIVAFSLLNLEITGDKLDTNTFQTFVIILFGSIGTLLTVWLFTKYVDKLRFSKLLTKYIPKQPIDDQNQ